MFQFSPWDFVQENILLQYLAPYVDGITRASLVAFAHEDWPLPAVSRGP